MRHLEIDEADVVGYSMGGGIALQLAIRHPQLVRKLVVALASFTSDGMHAVALEMFPSITPELFAGSAIEEAYLRTAPRPEDFPTLVGKLKPLQTTPDAWPAQDIRGDRRAHDDRAGGVDVVRSNMPSSSSIARGGVMGDLGAMPSSQLAVLSGTWHFVPPGVGVLDRATGCWR